MPLQRTSHLQKNVKQTVVCLPTALILMCRPRLPGISSHLSSKQGRPLTRCTQRRSAGKKTYKAPSRLLPAKQPVSTRGQTRGWPPSRAGAEVRRITSTPTLTFPRSLGCRQTTSATPLLASPGSHPRALSPPSAILTPPSPTCHHMSRQSTATSEHPPGVCVVFIALLSMFLAYRAVFVAKYGFYFICCITNSGRYIAPGPQVCWWRQRHIPPSCTTSTYTSTVKAETVTRLVKIILCQTNGRIEGPVWDPVSGLHPGPTRPGPSYQWRSPPSHVVFDFVAPET